MQVIGVDEHGLEIVDNNGSDALIHRVLPKEVYELASERAVAGAVWYQQLVGEASMSPSDTNLSSLLSGC